jgi:sugar phosphate isomerase/epimerase
MRTYSLAYLTASHQSVCEFIQIAADTGYDYVGLRLRPNADGAPYQPFIDAPIIRREVSSLLKSTGVKVFDIEIIRIGEEFDLERYKEFLEAGAELGAQAVLVAADDDQRSRLATNYAKLCEYMSPYGLSANLEFMPWTTIKNAGEAQALVREAGSPKNAGILVDALHYSRSKTSLSDIGSLPRELLYYAQMCDAHSGLNFTTEQMIHTAREERLLPGEGDIALVNLFKTLPSDLPISIEIPNFKRAQHLGELEWAKIALELTKQVLEV